MLHNTFLYIKNSVTACLGFIEQSDFLSTKYFVTKKAKISHYYKAGLTNSATAYHSFVLFICCEGSIIPFQVSLSTLFSQLSARVAPVLIQPHENNPGVVQSFAPQLVFAHLWFKYKVCMPGQSDISDASIIPGCMH